MAHLWEGKHPYYMNQGNYYQAGCHTTYPNLDAFLSDWDEADIDYNWIVRWDWNEVRGSNLGLTIGDVADDVLALTPADAQAALEARINAAKEDGRAMGLREGARLGNDLPDVNWDDPWTEYEHGVDDLQNAILAKIKEAGNG